MSLRSYLKGIADMIREKLNTSEPINAQDFSSKIEEVYIKAYDEGGADGIEFGKQAEYDAFWDNFQVNGTRSNYAYAFYTTGWNDNNYNPKYPFKVTGMGNMMFANSLITDIIQSIDVSNSNANKVGLFNNNQVIKTIPEIVVSEVNGFQDWFIGNGKLEYIRFKGTIAKTLNLQWSVALNTESAISIINCLKDFTGTGLENTCTLTFANEVWARLENTTPPDGYTSWRSYTESKGWLT